MELYPDLDATRRGKYTRNSAQPQFSFSFDSSTLFPTEPWLWPNIVVGSTSPYEPSPSHREVRIPRVVQSSTSASSIREQAKAASSVAASPMPPKRPATGSPNGGTPQKIGKTDNKPEDFSSSVKKRLQSSTRTGQACDRCKVRKIRCDGLETGCSPCLQNNTECRTTDRITGIATRRGQLTELQQENEYLKELLKRFGVNNPYEHAQPGFIQGPPQNGLPQPWSNGQQHSQSQSYPPSTSENHVLPQNVYGTLLSQTCHISSVRDILHILGMNMIDMEAPRTDHENAPYDTSYQSFLKTAHGVNKKIEHVDLPERDAGLQYAQWYFRVLNPYLPILHKASFMQLLTRVYDDLQFRPTVAETVMVHMMFACMFFQLAIRNLDDPLQQTNLEEKSNLHYHFSLQKFYEMTCNRTLQDAQAMTLVCLHLRSMPKPEACWMLSSHTLNLVKELGLHRSHKATENSNMSDYDIEVRKRVFYAILTLNAGLSGKLGRPMPMRPDDFDIEMPEPMDDDTTDECGMPLSQRSGKCGHHIGLQTFKIYGLYLEMYTTIYAVRRHPETYVQVVNELQQKLRQWKENLPAELVRGGANAPSHEGRVFALYAEIWTLEFRMLLRHPAVSMTTDANFNAESMRICIESSRQMFTVVKQMQALRSLDTTWYNTAILVLAITTTLYAAWEKRAEMTERDLATTRGEIEEWLGIMSEIGRLLGSGERLKDAVRTVTDRSLALLVASVKPSQLPPHPQPPTFDPHNTNSNNEFSKPRPPQAYQPQGQQQQQQQQQPPYPDTHSNPSPSPSHPPPQSGYSSTPYPAATQYYPVPPSTTTSTYDSTPTSAPYPVTISSNPNLPYQDPVDAPLLAAFAEQASQQAAAGNSEDAWRYANGLSAPVNGGQGGHQGQGYGGAGGSLGWMLFSSAIQGQDGGLVGGQGMNGHSHGGHSHGGHGHGGHGGHGLGGDEGLSAAVLLELGQGGNGGHGHVKSEQNGGGGVGQAMMGGWPGIVIDVNGQQNGQGGGQ